MIFARNAIEFNLNPRSRTLLPPLFSLSPTWALGERSVLTTSGILKNENRACVDVFASSTSCNHVRKFITIPRWWDNDLPSVTFFLFISDDYTNRATTIRYQQREKESRKKKNQNCYAIKMCEYVPRVDTMWLLIFMLALTVLYSFFLSISLFSIELDDEPHIVRTWNSPWGSFEQIN